MPKISVINQFSSGKTLVGITIYGGTNMAKCKNKLESNFDNMGVFYLGKLMVVMYCLSHVLENACKAGVMDLK